MSDSTPFRIALVGAGGIGSVHATAATDASVRIVAAAEPNPEACKAIAETAQCPTFPSFDDLLAASVTFDGVVVATPPSARLPIVQRSLDAGLPVLVEKPLAANVEEAQHLVDLAQRQPKLVTAVAYCHRFTPAIIRMREMLAADDLGPLIRFENVFACTIPGMESRWMSNPSVSGGGSLIDTGSHSLDLFQHLVGVPNIRAAVFDSPWTGRGEASSTVLLEAPTGEAGVVITGWREPARFVVRLVGAKALLEYDYDQPTTLFRVAADGGRDTIDIDTHEVRFARQLQAFVASVRGEQTELATFADGLAVARAIESAAAFVERA